MATPLTANEIKAYLQALKTRQATPESSAAFRKLLKHAKHMANATYNAVQLELFNNLNCEKRT